MLIFHSFIPSCLFCDVQIFIFLHKRVEDVAHSFRHQIHVMFDIHLTIISIFLESINVESEMCAEKIEPIYNL